MLSNTIGKLPSGFSLGSSSNNFLVSRISSEGSGVSGDLKIGVITICYRPLSLISLSLAVNVSSIEVF